MIKCILTPLRPAFSMLTAISVMLVMGLLSAFILSTSASTAEETFSQFHKEQATLLSEAYTEAAILAILRRDMAPVGAQCVQDISANVTTLEQGAAIGGSPLQGRGYHVDVNVSYITNTLTGFTTIKCPNSRILNLNAAGTAIIDFNNTFNAAASASLSAIIDVYVRYKNPNYPDMTTAPWITYHRRTLQKI